MLWSVLTFSAAVVPAPGGAADKLPQFLSPKDSETYRQIFALQEDGEIKEAAMLIKTLDSDLLMGHVLSQKYLHPTAWRSSLKTYQSGCRAIMITPLLAASNGCLIRESQKVRSQPKPRNRAI